MSLCLSLHEYPQDGVKEGGGFDRAVHTVQSSRFKECCHCKLRPNAFRPSDVKCMHLEVSAAFDAAADTTHTEREREREREQLAKKKGANPIILVVVDDELCCRG